MYLENRSKTATIYYFYCVAQHVQHRVYTNKCRPSESMAEKQTAVNNFRGEVDPNGYINVAIEWVRQSSPNFEAPFLGIKIIRFPVNCHWKNKNLHCKRFQWVPSYEILIHSFKRSQQIRAWKSLTDAENFLIIIYSLKYLN